jgi:hypothetical protein
MDVPAADVCDVRTSVDTGLCMDQWTIACDWTPLGGMVAAAC